jgi:hypothetical protein
MVQFQKQQWKNPCGTSHNQDCESTVFKKLSKFSMDEIYTCLYIILLVLWPTDGSFMPVSIIVFACSNTDLLHGHIKALNLTNYKVITIAQQNVNNG